MSKLQELIQQYCPDGVEYKKLGDICINTENIQWKDTVRSYRYIDLSSVDIQTHRILSTTEINKVSAPSRARQIVQENDILFATTRPTQMRVCIIPGEYDGEICSTGYCVLRVNVNIILPRFLFFVLGCNEFRAYLSNNLTMGNYPSISNNTLKEYNLPVPPLPVQEEIVKILDRFAEYAAELQAELQARKEQYEYYRNKLLSFNEIGGGISQVRWMKMSEIGTFTRGNGLQKKDFTESGVPCIHYGQIYTFYGTYATQTKSFISQETAKKCKKAHPGDLIIAATSENVEDAGKTMAWLGETDAAVSNHTFIFSHNQNPKYLAYLFQTDYFRRYKTAKVIGVKVIDIPQKALENFRIPIPPKEEQERIVSILDKFEKLTNDLTQGLPAEIELRHQQYEYYRNTLLSFPKIKLTA